MDFIKGETVNLLVKVTCNPVMERISVKPIGKGFAFNLDRNWRGAVFDLLNVRFRAAANTPQTATLGALRVVCFAD